MAWFQQLTGLLGAETVQPAYRPQGGYGYTGQYGYAQNAGAAYAPTKTSFTMPVTTTSDAPPPLVQVSNSYPPRNASFTQTYTVTQPQHTVQTVPRVASFTRYDPVPTTSGYPATTTTTYPAAATSNTYPVSSGVPRNVSFTRNPSFTRTSSFTAPVVTTTAPGAISTTTAPPAYAAPRVVKTSSFTSYPAAPVVKQSSFTVVPVVKQTSFTAVHHVQDPRIAAMNQAYSGDGNYSMSILRPPPPPPPPASDGFDRASYPDAYPRDQHTRDPFQYSPRDPNERPESYLTEAGKRRQKKGCCI